MQRSERRLLGGACDVGGIAAEGEESAPTGHWFGERVRKNATHALWFQFPEGKIQTHDLGPVFFDEKSAFTRV